MYACNVIYNKKCTFGPHPISGTEFLMPLEFPVMRAVKVSLIMLKRWFLESTQGTFGANLVFRGLELSVPPTCPPGREGRVAGDWIQSPVAHDLIYYAYLMKFL